MAGSFLSRAAGALRDPWSVLVTAIGAGSAWAAGLPLGGVALVGVGMLGAAAVAGGIVRDTATSREPLELVAGTAQKALVDALRGYLAELEELQTGGMLPAGLTSTGAAAVNAAQNATATAVRVAGAVDGIDRALSRAGTVASRMPGSGEVRGSIERMGSRRQALLGKLTSAVNGIGEVYTGLLELSTTAEMAGVAIDGLDEVAQVNESLDALRGAFEELERDASASRALL